jgi:hypothetical protein
MDASRGGSHEPASRRWSRTERFVLSETGRVAAQSYLDRIVASRAVVGRDSFDRAREDWAVAHGLASSHGLLLRELVSAPLTLHELVEKLDGFGPTAADVRKELTKLLDAGFVAPA